MTSENGTTRRAVLSALGACGVLVATPGFAASPAILSGAGDFRKLSLTCRRTGEWLNTVYWVEGEYIPEALDAISHLMRDWREDLVKPIDSRTIDIMSAAQKLLDTEEALQVVSGFRSIKTNALLRRRSRGVARNSYHIKGMAVDVKMQTRSVGQVGSAARALRAGGVGKYRGFVHMDSGPVRDWGRR